MYLYILFSSVILHEEDEKGTMNSNHVHIFHACQYLNNLMIKMAFHNYFWEEITDKYV